MTMSTNDIRRTACALALSLTAVVSLAACGSSSSSKSSSSSTPASTSGTTTGAANAAAAAEVPAAVKSKGTLTVAADASYAPNEFIGPDGHTVVGMDADLAKALAAELGLKAAVVNAKFDTIILGLTSGKYDLGMSSFTDTKAREKQVNFVTYFTAGTAFYGKASGAPPVTGLASLCGLKVGVESGTTQQTDAAAQSKKCTAGGKPAVTVLVFPDQNGANLALSSGRAQVVMADSPVAAYAVKQSNGQFKVIGTTYGTAPYGIAVPKSLGKLDQAILDGLKALMASGRYQQILQKWGIQAGGITSPVVNGATS
jgi:polar amino acid transport system substrate-binding protein